MKMTMREKRIQSGLTLRDISNALGKGFSQAKISLAERGLTNISVSDQVVILEAIERLTPLNQHRHRIAEIVRDMDFAPFVADVRAARCAAVQG
jgi:transcriptional regulator with XRE-family HTH domain